MKNICYFTLFGAVLALSSCSSHNDALRNVGGNYGLTKDITIDRDDCKLICGRAQGESKGFKLLGLISLKSPSESDALAAMYDNARSRGAKLEGESVTFANTSIERSSNYFILWSMPAIKISGDAVQYMGDGTPKK